MSRLDGRYNTGSISVPYFLHCNHSKHGKHKFLRNHEAPFSPLCKYQARISYILGHSYLNMRKLLSVTSQHV